MSGARCGGRVVLLHPNEKATGWPRACRGQVGVRINWTVDGRTLVAGGAGPAGRWQQSWDVRQDDGPHASPHLPPGRAGLPPLAGLGREGLPHLDSPVAVAGGRAVPCPCCRRGCGVWGVARWEWRVGQAEIARMERVKFGMIARSAGRDTPPSASPLRTLGYFG